MIDPYNEHKIVEAIEDLQKEVKKLRMETDYILTILQLIKRRLSEEK